MDDSEKNTYSIAALAAELNVPRTTVNDWLTRYKSFAESENVGRRKVYTGRTLALLREVAALRDQGRSGFEIESELARRHGVNPEISMPSAEVPPPSAAPSPEGADDVAAEGGASDGGEEFFPLEASRKQSGFQDFSQWMHAMREQQNMQKHRQKLLLNLTIALLVFMLAAALCAVLVWQRQTERRRAEQEKLAAALNETREVLTRAMADKMAVLEAGLQAERLRAAEASRRQTEEKEVLLRRHAAAMGELRAAWERERKELTAQWSELQRLQTEQQSADRREWLAEWEKKSREREAQMQLELNRLQQETERLRLELSSAREASGARSSGATAPDENSASRIPAGTDAGERP